MNRLLLRRATLLLTMSGLPLFAGCSVDNARHAFYEGFRTRNDLQSTPQERIGKQDSPDFQQYERLRKEQLR